MLYMTPFPTGHFMKGFDEPLDDLPLVLDDRLEALNDILEGWFFLGHALETG